MNSNAFVAGVQPGGLTNDYEVKILICYIMNFLEHSMSFTDFNNILIASGMVNYFEFTQALSELIQLGHIIEHKKEEYLLQPSGAVAAHTFESTLPVSVREKTCKTATQYFHRKTVEKDNSVTVKKMDIGYEITLNIHDESSTLMNLTLFAPDEEYCHIIKERFYNDPLEFYKIVIGLLTNDLETAFTIVSGQLQRKKKRL